MNTTNTGAAPRGCEIYGNICSLFEELLELGGRVDVLCRHGCGRWRGCRRLSWGLVGNSGSWPSRNAWEKSIEIYVLSVRSLER